MRAIAGWWAVKNAAHYDMLLAIFREKHHAKHFAKTWRSMTGCRVKVEECPQMSKLDIPEPALTQLARASDEEE